jgi:hypothetical protein
MDPPPILTSLPFLAFLSSSAIFHTGQDTHKTKTKTGKRLRPLCNNSSNGREGRIFGWMMDDGLGVCMLCAFACLLVLI